MFVSSESPDKNYKPLLSPTSPPPGTPPLQALPQSSVTPSDPCAAQRAEVKKLSQWVSYDRTASTPNLTVNLAKLSAATAVLEKCRSDALLGTWIMNIEGDTTEGLVSIQRATEAGPYSFDVDFGYIEASGVLNRSGDSLAGSIVASGDTLSIRLAQGTRLRASLDGHYTDGDKYHSKGELHRPGPGGIEGETGRIIVKCGDADVVQIGSGKTSLPRVGCSPGETRPFKYLKPAKWYVTGGRLAFSDRRGCSVDITMQASQTVTVTLAPIAKSATTCTSSR